MGIRRTWKRIPTWVKITAGSVLLLLAVGLIGVNVYLNNLVNKRLRKMVHESSDGLYTLDYSRVSMNAFSGNVTIHNAKLTPDSAVFARLLQMRQAPRFLIGGKAEKLSVKNVRWLAFLNSQKLNIDKLIIERPEFSITQYKQAKDSAGKTPQVFNFISKKVKDLNLGVFSINDAVVHYQVSDTAAGERTLNTVEHLDLGFTGVHYGGSKDSAQYLTADDYFIDLKEYKHRTADSLYWVGITGLKYNSKQRRASLASLFSSPRYEEAAFSKQVGHQETRYELELKNIVADGFDATALVEENVVRIKTMSIESGSANFYMNRGYPLPEEDKKNIVISQRLLGLDFPLLIEALAVKNFGLAYKEYNPVSGKTAALKFEGISGKAVNITNVPSVISGNPQMKVSLGAIFLGAQLKAAMSFALNKTDGSFTASLDVNQVAAEKLNGILTAMAMIEAREGILQKLESTVSGNASRAVADVTLLYEDLKINLLEKKDGALEKKGLKSVFANIMVYDDNPKDGNLRMARQVTVARKRGKSFFNLAWSAVAAGIIEIIMKEKGIRL